MGTSQSSKGPGGGVPLVPPWVPDLNSPTPPEPPDGQDSPESPPAAELSVSPTPLARAGRFSAARRSFGSFAHSGDSRDMQRGLGHYTRNGYGGAGIASRRLSRTSATAAMFNRVLEGLSRGSGASGGDVPLDARLFAGKSADEVMNAVVEAVRSIDGSLDAEASRAAILDGLSELFTRFPDADLLNLTDEQRAFAVERYASNDVFRRIQLDIGKTIHDKSPTAAVALARLKQIRDYVKETVAASFRKLRDSGSSLTAGNIERIVRDAIRDTFGVFEGFAE